MLTEADHRPRFSVSANESTRTAAVAVSPPALVPVTRAVKDPAR
jgi:hypothetical protein